MDLEGLKQNGPALFGRDGLSHFKVNWQEVKVMKLQQATQNTDAVLQSILNKHQAVFGPGIGKLEGITASLYLKDNVLPNFLKLELYPILLDLKWKKNFEEVRLCEGHLQDHMYGGLKLIRILKICVTPAVDVRCTVTCRNLPQCILGTGHRTHGIACTKTLLDPT